MVDVPSEQRKLLIQKLNDVIIKFNQRSTEFVEQMQTLITHTLETSNLELMDQCKEGMLDNYKEALEYYVEDIYNHLRAVQGQLPLPNQKAFKDI